MQEFLNQLGIDWRLLLSQAINFALVFVLLRMFVYKPVLQVLHERKKKIQEGLLKAQEAGIRLKEVDQIAKNKLVEAEREAITIIQSSEKRGKQVETNLVEQARKKEKELLEKTLQIIQRLREQEEKKLHKESIAFIKNAIAKTVELSPEQIDEALIKKAVAEAK